MNPEPNSIAAEPKRVSLAKFVGYFLRLGTVGFGGPIALAGHMQQDLVDERGWVRKEDYLEGLALAQLAPGPLAAQLAIYLGYPFAQVCSGLLRLAWRSCCHPSLWCWGSLRPMFASVGCHGCRACSTESAQR